MKKSVGGTDTVIEVGAGGGISSSFIAYEYTATANQTTFSGSDNNSNTLAYNTGTPPSVQVFMNGILLDEGSSQDYTGTNGTSVVLTTAADAGDLIQIHAYKSDVSIVSNLLFNDNQKVQFGDSQDLEIFHDGSHSRIKDVGTGNLILNTQAFRVNGADDSEGMIKANQDGNVELYYNGVKKFETTTGGTQVQGSMAATTGAYSPIYYGGSSSLQLKSNTGELFAQFTNNGTAQLYHDNSSKLTTTSLGIDVTGEVQADSLDIDGLSVLTSNNVSAAVTIERANATSNQVGIQFSAGNSRYFGKGTDDEPYWATSANLTGGSKIVTAGNFTGILDSTYYQSGDNISVGTISSGAITSSGLLTLNDYAMINAGTTSNTTLERVIWARSQIGASVVQMNVQGDEWQFGGGGTLDTTPILKLKNSTNAATFAGTISSGAITSTGASSFGSISLSGGVDFNGYNANGVNQINGTSSSGWLDFNMDTDSVYPQSTVDNQTVLGSVTHMNFVGDSNGNGTGGRFYWGYGTDGADNGTFTQTMELDRSGNLTTIGAIDATKISVDSGGSLGLRLHTNSGITASNNYMNFFTGQTSGWSFNANTTGADSNSVFTISPTGAIESTSLQTQNIYLSTALYTLNTAGNGWDSTISRNSGSPTANLPGGITSGNITTTGYLRGPSTFTIDPAAHGDDTGTVVIAGNLQIDGTTTTINSTTLTVDDKNITLASGSANAAAANGAGLTVDGANATWTYSSGDDAWASNKHAQFYTGGGTGSLSVGRTSDQAIRLYADDNYNRIFAYQDSDTNGDHFFDLVRSFQGTGKADMRFMSGTAVHAVLNKDGNFGIGETNPTHKLHVAGDIRIDNGSALKLYNAAGNGWAQIAYNNTLDHIEIQRSFQSATDSYYNLGSSGKKWLSVYSDTIKASNGTPAAPTYTFDSDQNTGMYIDSTGDTLRFSTGGVQRMYLNNAGITSAANIYSGTTSEFRNYGGTWKATTGTAAGDFEFRGNTGGTNTGLMYMDTSTGRVAVGNGFNSTNVKSEFQVDHAGIDTYAVNTSATSAAQVDTFPAADFRSARFTVQITNTTDSTYQITEILLIHDGTTPSMTEYGTIFTGSAAEATFDADIVSGNIRLLATPASADSMQFKVVRHSILV